MIMKKSSLFRSVCVRFEGTLRCDKPLHDTWHEWRVEAKCGVAVVSTISASFLVVNVSDPYRILSCPVVLPLHFRRVKNIRDEKTSRVWRLKTVFQMLGKRQFFAIGRGDRCCCHMYAETTHVVTIFSSAVSCVVNGLEGFTGTRRVLVRRKKPLAQKWHISLVVALHCAATHSGRRLRPCLGSSGCVRYEEK